MPNILSLTEVQALGDFGDFFRPSTEETDRLNHPDLFNEADPEPETKTNDPQDADSGEKKDTSQPAFYSDADEYVCQNPKCKYLANRDELSEIHVYEINANDTVNICNDCYHRGYRFCLFSHDVLHLDTLDPVLESCPPVDTEDGVIQSEHYYAHKDLHHGQLHPDVLSQIEDLIEYFKIIGIENPCPTHIIIDLTTPPVFNTDEA